ncbi:hypothetical protein BDK92_7276 [Micromonospora pisi]|uniref:Uncharacterized protein n=1 Tax=Micromonospora pisi TaxID=589240 RepID=A0A495JX07_9ACTN|nr:hypothetical protein [Micromonospora pisi]RKR92794.1 hypothetical protein BDK92_7276 [Micromonospora pisi]
MADVHVMPVGDLVAHDRDAACVCGPTTEPVPTSDGRIGWVIVHHSLDGREHGDRRPTCPTCVGPVDRMQRAFGVVAPYPCGHWLTPDQAQAIADQHRATRSVP